MQKIEINETSYAYNVYGSGPPLLLLHGFTGTSHTWHFLMDTLSHSYTIMTIDLPGHGQTKSKSFKSMVSCCDDLKQLLVYNGFDKVHLLGYSLGGRTALSFSILYPEMVSSLILESASPGLKTLEERDVRQTQDEILARKIELEGIVNFVNYWESIALFSSQLELPQSVQQSIRQERLSQSPQGLALSLRAMGTGKQPSWWHRLSEIKQPVCLIVGELDPKFVDINKDMIESIPTAYINIVAESGHAIHLEQPEKFTTIIDVFLKDIEYGGELK